MLKHHLISLIRSIKRRKLLSFINITGFAFAIAFVLLISQYIFYEYNQNSDLPEADNIYRVVNGLTNNYWIDYRFKDAVKENITGISSAGVFNHFTIEAKADEQFYNIEHLIIADPGFLEIYNFKFLYGSAKTSLVTTDGLIITESTAMKIFGTADVLGRNMILNHESEMKITGVIKDPENVSLQVELIASYLNVKNEKLAYRTMSAGKTVLYPFSILIKLNSNVSPENAAQRIAALHSQNKFIFPPNVKLIPLKENYFNTGYEDYDLTHGNSELIRILSIIGLLILVLSIINYINLSTAAYRYRINEIGIKKCFGIGRSTLIKQLLMESVVICTVSAIFSVLIAELFLPYFNRFTEKNIPLQVFQNPAFTLAFFISILLIGFLTGIIPSLALSKISPLQLFRLDSYIKGPGKFFRNILTISQYSIATILIFALIIMANQIDYVKHKDMGFNTERLLYIKTHYRMSGKVNPLADKLSSFPYIKSLSKTFGIPGDLRLEGNEGKIMVIDSLTLKTFGFNIVKGRDLLPGDLNHGQIINMAAWKKWELENFSNEMFPKESVIGVVSDFNFAPLYSAGMPLVLYYSENWGTSHITLRTSGPVPYIIEYIKKSWKEICPEYPLEFGFYDEMFASFYRTEENLATLISIFTILAIIISSLGIFGLAFYQSERRTKEMGIRKVFGADPLNLFYMQTRGYGLLVLISNLIALPIGYYIMQKWLEQFAYRIEFSWYFFLFAGAISLFIALSVVSFQSIKSALVKPVNSLRYE